MCDTENTTIKERENDKKKKVGPTRLKNSGTQAKFFHKEVSTIVCISDIKKGEIKLQVYAQLQDTEEYPEIEGEVVKTYPERFGKKEEEKEKNDQKNEFDFYEGGTFFNTKRTDTVEQATQTPSKIPIKEIVKIEMKKRRKKKKNAKRN